MMQSLPPNPTHYDLAIAGAGMVGQALAAALSHTSLRIALIEARTPGEKEAQDDGRASAISLGSVQILEQIGAWQPMQHLGVSPIHRVQISDQGFDSVTHLNREDIAVEALGYVVENRVTEAGLQAVIAQSPAVSWIQPAKVSTVQSQGDRLQVTLVGDGQPPSISARLVVAADGRQSSLRQGAGIAVQGWPYEQMLLVANVTTEFSHQQTGYERFHASGPFAVLPMVPPPDAPQTHRSCVVWTVNRRDRDRLMALKDDDFIQALQPQMPPQVGRVRSVSPRHSYAPRRQHVQRYFSDRLALIGDAAHATHPVGGQGLNMGLRDVATLASLLIQAQVRGVDLGSPAVLQRYEQQRRPDNETVLLGTDLANRLFSNRWLPLQGIRRLALLGVDQVPPLKQLLIRYAMGLADSQPSTVGVSLP